MTNRRRMGTDERRARLGVRHRLAPGRGASTLAEAAASMVALHATDSASVFLQARARMTESSPEGLELAMYEERSVMRLLAMRRTLFLVPLADVAIVFTAASRSIGAIERRRTISMLAEAGVGADPAAHLEKLEEVGLAAVRQREEAPTAVLTRSDPRLAERISVARGKTYEGSISLGSRVFLQLAVDGRIGRGRPLGTWIGSQFRWSPIERWFPGGIPEIDVDEARAELVRRWLRAFGPGTRDDIRWWTGWTVGATRQALASINAVEVDLDDGELGYLLPDDWEPVVAPAPWVTLLPALDATTMGWKSRAWYLGPHRAALFDTNGNAGPTVWVDGHIVGGWAQRKTGEVVPRLLEDVGAEIRHAIDAEAGRLEAWIGPTRVSASFPTPVEVALRRA